MMKRICCVILALLVPFSAMVNCSAKTLSEMVAEYINEAYYYEISPENKEKIESLVKKDDSEEKKCEEIAKLLDEFSGYYTAEFFENQEPENKEIRDIHCFETVDSLYVKIDIFSTDTGKKFKEITKTLNGEKDLYLDLSDCTGGFITSMVDVAGCLLPGSVVCRAKFKNSEKEYRTRITESAVQFKTLYVVVSPRTASAGEILAGFVKTREIGSVIGDNTFGKTAIQQLIKMPSGGVLKLTVGEYVVPDVVILPKVGLTPDLIMPKEQ